MMILFLPRQLVLNSVLIHMFTSDPVYCFGEDLITHNP